MKNLLKTALTTAILALPLSIGLTSPVQSQSIGSLGEMPCYEIKSGNYDAINRDITIGFEVFRAIGIVDGPTYKNRFPVQLSCRLAENGEIPRYQTLTLAFGLDSSHRYSPGATLRLSVYLDGNFYVYQDITNGDKLLLDVDIQNIRSLGMKLECLRGSSFGSGGNVCPDLYMTQDTLE